MIPLSRIQAICISQRSLPWKDGAEDSLRLFQQHGLPVFIVTNQGGIARAYFTEAQMHIFHDKALAETAKIGGHITDIAFCPHHPFVRDRSVAHPLFMPQA